MTWKQLLICGSFVGLCACGDETVTLKIDNVENLDCATENCQHVIQVTVSNWMEETTDRSVKVEWAENSIQAVGEVPFTGNTTYLVNLTTSAVPESCPSNGPTVNIIASLLNTGTQTTELDEVEEGVTVPCNESEAE